MKIEMSVAEVVSLFKEIQDQPKQIFEMIRVEIRENVGQYLSKLMEVELTHFLSRDRYERAEGEANHRNGFYGRKFALKGIGQVQVEVLISAVSASSSCCSAWLIGVKLGAILPTFCSKSAMDFIPTTIVEMG
ncbi:MAG: transposase [Deltaproteobacteria bacterium]|nr:transposase [Deltaproteobacteria bacterium]